MSILDRVDRIRMRVDDPGALTELDLLEADLVLMFADLRVARSQAAAGDDALRRAMDELDALRAEMVA